MTQKDQIRADICSRAIEAFRADLQAAPQKTLRGGSAEDSYDEPTDEYLEAYTFWGLGYLDAASWRHYLPYLIDYAFRYMDDPRMAVEGVLHNLRPPDREPPRLASLSAEQEAVIKAFLDELAFSDDSAYRDFAMQVMEEWWVPGALYRPGYTQG